MKDFLPIELDRTECRRQLDRFQTLLRSKHHLSERDDLQPLFRQCPQLAAFLGSCVPNIGPADRLAYEFEIFGDYSADIVIGNFDRKTFCAVELEDAHPNSIFRKRRNRSASEWSRRLENGFSQLVDWFYSFDKLQHTPAFSRHFGYGHIEFFGMLLIGRSADISEHDFNRLRWRSGRVTINTHRIICRTYDELFEDLSRSWRLFDDLGRLGTGPQLVGDEDSGGSVA